MAQGEGQRNCAPTASDLPTYADAVKDRQQNPSGTAFDIQSLYHLFGYVLIFIFGLSAGIAIGSHMERVGNGSAFLVSRSNSAL